MKYKITDFELLRWNERENFDLIIWEKNNSENISAIIFENNLKIKFFHNLFEPKIRQNEKFLYIFDNFNIFQINLKNLEIKNFSCYSWIFEIYFWKDFLVIYSELEIIILDKNLKILKDFSTSGIIENFEISKNFLKFSDENWKSFDFDLKTLS